MRREDIQEKRRRIQAQIEKGEQVLGDMMVLLSRWTAIFGVNENGDLGKQHLAQAFRHGQDEIKWLKQQVPDAGPQLPSEMDVDHIVDVEYAEITDYPRLEG